MASRKSFLISKFSDVLSHKYEDIVVGSYPINLANFFPVIFLLILIFFFNQVTNIFVSSSIIFIIYNFCSQNEYYV